MPRSDCPICGRNYYHERSRGKYCSKACMSENRRRKLIDAGGIPGQHQLCSCGGFYPIGKSYGSCSKCSTKRPPRRNPHYRTWVTWHSMLTRCENASHASYQRYGARGIYVCEQWREFDRFVADMGLVPDGRSLDRIDNDGPYSPDNCRWATVAEQSNNKRSNVRIDTPRGRMTIAEASVAFGITYERLRGRVKNHPPEMWFIPTRIKPGPRPKRSLLFEVVK